MDTRRPVAGSSRGFSHHLIRFRHIPGPKRTSSGSFHHCIHWCSNCAWRYQHVPSDCCSDSDWIWFLYGSTGVQRTERNRTEEMETQYVCRKRQPEFVMLIPNLIVAQAAMNFAAALGGCSGPLMIGALTKANPHTGWRNFYVSSESP
jgi:hypothetical protein